MNCYHHHDHPALGICKSCNKGLCWECAVDVGNGLACKNSCEAEVKALNEVLERSKTAYQKTGKAYKRNAFISGLLGVAFLLWGILQVALTGEAELAILFVPFGLISLIASFFNFRNARQIARVEK